MLFEKILATTKSVVKKYEHQLYSLDLIYGFILILKKKSFNHIINIRKEEFMITRKSRDEIKKMRHAGYIVALVHKKMKEVIEPGISTKELDSKLTSILSFLMSENKCSTDLGELKLGSKRT